MVAEFMKIDLQVISRESYINSGICSIAKVSTVK